MTEPPPGRRPALGIAFLGAVDRSALDETLGELVGSGVRSFWASEHVVGASRLYKTDFGDPFVDLAAIGTLAGGAVALGTNLALGAVHGTALLQRSVAAISRYSEHPIRLGLGVGWSSADYAATGRRFESRGTDLDRVISDLRWLWSDGRVGTPSAQAEVIARRGSIMPVRPAIVLAGGGRTAGPGAPVELPPRVARRIAQSDGWLLNPNATAAQLHEDLEVVRALDGNVRDVADCYVSMLVHLPDGGAARTEAVVQQRSAYERFFGAAQTEVQLGSSVLLGSTTEIVERLEHVSRTGPREIILFLIPPDAAQLRRAAELARLLTPG